MHRSSRGHLGQVPGLMLLPASVSRHTTRAPVHPRWVNRGARPMPTMEVHADG
jgi:hypothetical protein